jgi:hypothetical protein
MSNFFLVGAILIVVVAGLRPAAPSSGSRPGPQPAPFACYGRGQAPAARDSSGIEGLVTSVSGNRMPSPSLKPGPHPGTGVRSTVCVFRLTNTSQATRQGQSAWYTAVGTELVAQADTDEKGRFVVMLPPGQYSVFTRKGDLYYASRMDEKNNISPVQVLPGKMTKLECRVESVHKAVY